MRCSFLTISFFGLKFLQYTLNILYFRNIKKKSIFRKPEHETTCLSWIAKIYLALASCNADVPLALIEKVSEEGRAFGECPMPLKIVNMQRGWDVGKICVIVDFKSNFKEAKWNSRNRLHFHKFQPIGDFLLMASSWLRLEPNDNNRWQTRRPKFATLANFISGWLS